MCDKSYFVRSGRRGALWIQSLTLVFLIMASSGCEQKKTSPPRPVPDLKPVISSLNRHFEKAPPGNGWKISSVSSQESQVQIMVAIPSDQASLIMRRPAEEQFRAVASAVCPPTGAEAYRLLPSGAEIKVLPTVSGQVFIEVDCGH